MNCLICNRILKSKIETFNVCKSRSCEVKYLNHLNKTYGLSKVVSYLESKNCYCEKLNHYKMRLNKINNLKFKERKIRKYKNVNFVYSAKLSEELVMLIGLNYAYIINRKGQLSKVYNLNEDYESLEEIKRRLNGKDLFILEPFFVILDDRKSIEKFNDSRKVS